MYFPVGILGQISGLSSEVNFIERLQLSLIKTRQGRTWLYNLTWALGGKKRIRYSDWLTENESWKNRLFFFFRKLEPFKSSYLRQIKLIFVSDFDEPRRRNELKYQRHQESVIVKY